MSIPRLYLAHAVLSGRLFAIGGRINMNGYQNSVEYYEPSTNKWQSVAPMIHARVRAAAHVSNGFIYVVGGLIDTINMFETIDRYNPCEDSWTQVIHD